MTDAAQDGIQDQHYGPSGDIILVKRYLFYLHLLVEFTIIIYSYGIMNCDCDKSSTTWCSHYA